jgi:hypothetical protein
VNVVPGGISFGKIPFASFDHRSDGEGGDHGSLVDRSSSWSVYDRWADDGRPQRCWVCLGGLQDDLVDVPMRSLRWEVDEVGQAFPVVVGFTMPRLTFVGLVSEETGTGYVDVIGRLA